MVVVTTVLEPPVQAHVRTVVRTDHIPNLTDDRSWETKLDQTEPVRCLGVADDQT